MPELRSKPETWQEHRDAVDNAAQALFDAINAFSKHLGHNNPNLRIIVTSSEPTSDKLIYKARTIHAWTDKVQS